MPYDELTPEQVKELSNAVNALSEPLSRPHRDGAVLTDKPTPRPRLSRRGLLGGGVALAGVAGAFAAGRTTAAADAGVTAGRPRRRAASESYAFRGAHQAGIVTPAQDRLHFAASTCSPTTARRSSTC